MPTIQRLRALDLFAGAGGMSLGFEQAGFDVVGAVELDPIHCATHEFNFPQCKVLCADASLINGSRILSELGLHKGDLDVVVGGPPCQGFSLIGKREVNDSRNHLIHHFLRIVSEVSPRYFVMENVAGLMIGHARSMLNAFLSSARDLGYSIVEPCRVLNAANYGVPQDRRRVFVIGFRKGMKSPKYPEAITIARQKTGEEVGKRLALEKQRYCPSVWDAIGDLPDIDGFPELLENDSVLFKPKGGSRYARILRGDSADPGDFSYVRRIEAGRLTSSLRSEHTALSRKRFGDTRPGDTEPISRFFKLAPTGICNTIRAGTPSNRGAFTSPRPIHPSFPRCISVREAARLHSYPDWFRFHMTKWHGFRQIGNSVPPLLARAVASEIVRALREVPSVPRNVLATPSIELLRVDMKSAAVRYGVSPHVIEPRVREAARA